MVFGLFGRKSKYQKAVEYLNQVLGRDDFKTRRYVSIGISLMEQPEITGFTPKAMCEVTSRIEDIIESVEPLIFKSRAEADPRPVFIIASKIFNEYARAHEALAVLDDLCAFGKNKSSYWLWNRIAETFADFVYSTQPVRRDSKPHYETDE